MTLANGFRVKHVVICLSVVLFAFAANAQETLKFAHVYEVASPYHEAAEMAAEMLAERTDGRYTMDVFPASSLGVEEEINESLSLGVIDVIYTGPGFASRAYGPIGITDYPFTLRSLDHWKGYRDSELFAELSQGYADETGNEVVAITYYGSRHVTANKPILKPEDMEGLKIRVPNAPAYVMFPETVGANPTPMAFAEVYLALQQGVVDAQENPLPTIQFKKFYEVQSNINLTGHITNSIITVISGFRLAGMNDEDAQILKDVLEESAAWASTQIEESEAELADWFRDEGVTVNVVDRAPFIEAVKPALIADGLPWTPEIYERLQAIEDAN